MINDVPACYGEYLVRCSRFRIANATLTEHAMDRLSPLLRTALSRGATGEFIVGLDLVQARPSALKALMAISQDFRRRLSCYVIQLGNFRTFHPKLAIFDLDTEQLALIGSSNLSESAWSRNLEADAILRDQETIGGLEQQFDRWLSHPRCHELNDSTLAVAEAAWKEGAPQRRASRTTRSAAARLPLRFQAESAVPSVPKPQRRSNVASTTATSQIAASLGSSDVLNRTRMRAILESFAPGCVIDKDHSPLSIEVKGACRFVDVHVTNHEHPDRVWLELYPADVLSQARTFYDNIKVEAFLDLGVDEETGDWSRGLWTYSPNFHFGWRKTLFVSPTTQAWDMRSYLEVWKHGRLPVALIERGSDNYASAMAPYYETGVLSPAVDGPLFERHVGRMNYKKAYPIPGLRMKYQWTLDDAQALAAAGELGVDILARIEEAFTTWSQTFHPVRHK